MGLTRLINLYKILRKLSKLIRSELRSQYIKSFRGRIKSWCKGFQAEDYAIYNLDQNPAKDYVSTIQEKFKTPQINGRYKFVLNNKLIFYKMLAEFKEHLPEIYFVILNDEVYSNDSERTLEKDAINHLIKQKTDFVIKKIYGGGGQFINIIRNYNDATYFNGNQISDSEICKIFPLFNNCIFTEYINQADYSKKIFSNSANTIRILTMWDIKYRKPFIAVAVHRFGTQKSNHVDNFDAGGICSHIDVPSGVLGKSFHICQEGKIRWSDYHPDTTAPIKGIEITRWETIKKKILYIAHSFPMIPYIGWDVIATDQTFKIIEANNHPGLTIIQAHKPLLQDKKIIHFYRQHGVIKQQRTFLIGKQK